MGENMRFRDILVMCLRNLTKRKARTFLTVSGVIIGTCAIIVMISLGVGMTESMDQMISQWADLTLINVYNYGGVQANGEEVPDLDDKVLEQIAQLDHVKSVTPFYTNLSSGQQIAVYSEDYIFQGPIVGVNMEALEDFGYELEEGRYFNRGDGETTIIMGQNAVANLYNYVEEEYEWTETDENNNPIDPLIDIFEDEIKIIPMTRSADSWEPDYDALQSASSVNKAYEEEANVIGRIKGNYRDYYTMSGIFMDIDYINELIRAYNEVNDEEYQMEEITSGYTDVRVRVDDMEYLDEVETAIQEMGYNTYSDNQSRENMMQQTRMIQMVLGALAAVSLFVAALNITNTMIMSIIERTREIGIMKVLGCDVSKIRLIFLSEAGAIGFIGGVLGVVVSYIVSFVLNKFLSSSLMSALGGMGMEGNISVIKPELILLGLVFATLVGLISGFYPANRTVKISALEAIKHD